MAVPTIRLNTGAEIPQVGLGLWQVREPAVFEAAFRQALLDGYRHFDTAQAYGNESMFGACWHESGLKREELFITTKIGVQNFGKHRTANSLKRSLEALETDYVDLLLLHFPVPLLRNRSYKQLEKIMAQGKAKAIGVSNFTIKHLDELLEKTNIVPAVNQVELHVFLQQPELLKYCREKGIVVEAYSPLAHAKDMDNQMLKELAKRHGKSYAQIMLRWCIQQGMVVLPKSVTPKRITENIDIFDFELSADEMAELTRLDRDLRTCWNPTRVP